MIVPGDYECSLKKVECEEVSACMIPIDRIIAGYSMSTI